MSFRSKVLDALDIKKDHVRIPIYQTFLNPNESADAVIDDAAENCQITDVTAITTSDYKPYAVSKCIQKLTIGPHSRTERLELLGFVVGDDPGTAPQLPDAINRPLGNISPATSVDYTGIHYLGGLYDSSNLKLANMRKSAVKHDSMQTMYMAGQQPGESLTQTELDGGKIYHHTHTDWPSTLSEQCILLNENPMADALYYHKTQIRFLLTGIDDISSVEPSGKMDQASNHRGTVRMLVLRPRTPAVRTRVDGTSGEFIMNHDFMPNWDTQLFYDKNKQLGGKLDSDSWPHTESNLTYGGMFATSGTTVGATSPLDSSKYSSDVVTYGLKYAENPSRYVDKNPASQTFGHMKPSTVLPNDTSTSTTTNMIQHQLTCTDMLMSKINKQKFAVLHDEVFTLDSLHHGAASQHIVNVNIPYYKKVKFAGRQSVVDVSKDALSHYTLDEPMNMSSRPIVLFLSYNQKISASVEGFTAISEV